MFFPFFLMAKKFHIHLNFPNMKQGLFSLENSITRYSESVRSEIRAKGASGQWESKTLASVSCGGDSSWLLFPSVLPRILEAAEENFTTYYTGPDIIVRTNPLHAFTLNRDSLPKRTRILIRIPSFCDRVLSSLSCKFRGRDAEQIIRYLRRQTPYEVGIQTEIGCVPRSPADFREDIKTLVTVAPEFISQRRRSTWSGTQDVLLRIFQRRPAVKPLGMRGQALLARNALECGGYTRLRRRLYVLYPGEFSSAEGDDTLGIGAGAITIVRQQDGGTHRHMNLPSPEEYMHGQLTARDGVHTEVETRSQFENIVRDMIDDSGVVDLAAIHRQAGVDVRVLHPGLMEVMCDIGLLEQSGPHIYTLTDWGKERSEQVIYNICLESPSALRV